MLDIIFIILVLFTILLMLYAITERNIAFCMMSAVLWLIIALFMIQGIEAPYQIYNATSGKIETGLQVIQSNLTPLSYLFMGLAAVMFILTITFMMETLSDSRKTR